MQKEDTGKEDGLYNQTKNQTKPLKNLDAALKEDSYQIYYIYIKKKIVWFFDKVQILHTHKN